MTSNNKLIKQYIKKVKKNCPHALRKRLDAELKNNLTEFCEGQDSITMEMIEKRFGKPEQHVAEYLPLCDGTDLAKKLNHSKIIKITVLITSIIFILSVVGTMFFIIKYNESTSPSQIYINVTEECKLKNLLKNQLH